MAEAQIEQLKQLLLLKIGNPKQIEENYIDLCLDLAVQKVKNYCSLDEIPAGLNQTVTDIARDYYWYYESVRLNSQSGQTSTADNIMDVDLRAVTEVKMGDTQIKLNGAALDSELNKLQWSAHSVNLDTILDPYKSDLVEYRRLVW